MHQVHTLPPPFSKICSNVILPATPKEELCNLFASLNIIRVIKSRIMRWAEHVVRIGAMRIYPTLWPEEWMARGQLGDKGVDGRIILECILQN
jgi:hypothetical protein